eukprot:4306-Heterococcus_DN1.PRE.1
MQVSHATFIESSTTVRCGIAPRANAMLIRSIVRLLLRSITVQGGLDTRNSIHAYSRADTSCTLAYDGADLGAHCSYCTIATIATGTTTSTSTADTDSSDADVHLLILGESSGTTASKVKAV